MVAPNGAIVPLHLYTHYDDKSGYVASRERDAAAEPAPINKFAGLDYPGAMLPIGLGLLAWWGFLIARAWGNPHARLFWKGGSLLSLPDLFYRNIILGSQVLLATPVASVVWTQAEGNAFALCIRDRSCCCIYFCTGSVKPRDGQAALPARRDRSPARPTPGGRFGGTENNTAGSATRNRQLGRGSIWESTFWFSASRLFA